MDPTLAAAPITVVVPTFNEELNIEACLSSVEGWVAKILVVDSGSTDRTVELARAFGADVVTHPFEGAPKQWSWILNNVDFSTTWILFMDADHTVTPELKTEILEEFRERGGPRAAGYYFRHRQIFLGRFLKHGGLYPSYRLHLFKRDAVSLDEHDLVEHRFYLSGPAKRLEHDIVESNEKERHLSFWITKQVAYAEGIALEEVARADRRASGYRRASLRGGRSERIIWLKRVWARLPLYWRSVGFFLYRYVLRGGFLDGKEGFLYHLTQGLLLRVVLDHRVDELRRKGDTHTPLGS